MMEDPRRGGRSDHGHRNRSRSRSRSRERRSKDDRRHRRRSSRSASRSRSRSPPRDRFAPPPPTAQYAMPPAYGNFGVPAPAPMPAPMVAPMFGQQGVIQSNMNMAINPMIAGMLQQAVMPGAYAPIVDKAELELFVGNTPPGTSEFVLLNFLNAAMAQVNLNTQPGPPIIQCRVSNKYAFIELRSKDETNNALSLNGIPFMGIPLKVGRPSKYRGPPIEAATWQMLTGQPPLPTQGGVNAPGSIGTGGLDASTKVYRELYVGNCNPSMSDAAIAEFLGTTLHKVGLTQAPGNPVVNCRSNGNFAFIELRSIEDANAMLNLNGIPFMGNILKVSRPAKYPGPMTPAMNWSDVLARIMAQGDGAALGIPQQPQATVGSHIPMQPQSALAPALLEPATRVLRLNNMLSAEDLQDEEGLADIEEETKTECTTFGPVRKVHIVRPSSTVAGAAAATTGVGFVFVEFEEPAAARKAMLSLSTRTFDGKKVEVVFWDEAKFARQDYGVAGDANGATA